MICSQGSGLRGSRRNDPLLRASLGGACRSRGSDFLADLSDNSIEDRKARPFDRILPDRRESGRHRPAAHRRSGVSNPPDWGGREGLAMLNRTNRTLSANTNRLNLGTRNLALLAGDNHGSSTLRTAHAIPVVVVRTGIKDHPGILLEAPPIKAGPKRRKPSMMSEMSGSSPRLSSPARGTSGPGSKGRPPGCRPRPKPSTSPGASSSEVGSSRRKSRRRKVFRGRPSTGDAIGPDERIGFPVPRWAWCPGLRPPVEAKSRGMRVEPPTHCRRVRLVGRRSVAPRGGSKGGSLRARPVLDREFGPRV